jgi:transcription elongation factor Elf1
MIDTAIAWPRCARCGGPNWKVNSAPHKEGVEEQFFTCAVCGHITERRVPLSAEDIAALLVPQRGS